MFCMVNTRAAFFFGSGISRESGAPMADQLTDAVLHGAWEAHTDMRFYPSSSPSVGEAERAQEFLRIVNAHINPHIRGREERIANYEDLYGAAIQIVWDETAEIVNPLIAESNASIRKATEHLFGEQRAHIDNNRYASLAERASDLVQWVVFHELSKARKPVGLDVVGQAAGATDELDIFTLNHDLLLERQLEQEGIAFADGFGEHAGDAMRFNWSWNKDGMGVRLYKLHGSIDWYLLRSKSNVDQFCKVRADPDHCTDEYGNRLSLLQPQPRFLTGTIVKEQSYGTSVTGECFAELRTRLAGHDTLIICGYGWGDKGINVRINQWLRDAPKNKLVILHKSEVGELYAKRFWFFRWEQYERAGKVVILPQWLSECTVLDLEPFFG
jgi:hypothetical protein